MKRKCLLIDFSILYIGSGISGTKSGIFCEKSAKVFVEIPIRIVQTLWRLFNDKTITITRKRSHFFAGTS